LAWQRFRENASASTTYGYQRKKKKTTNELTPSGTGGREKGMSEK